MRTHLPLRRLLPLAALTALAAAAAAPAVAEPPVARHLVVAVADASQPRILVRWNQLEGARRFLVDRVRYISTPSDHLHLALLIAIGLSGLTMRFVAHTDVVAVKAFMLGLMRFSIQPLPADPLLLIHLTLVAVLMIVFPVSKLLHAPGLFFSPTRNQSDDPRESRHLAAWASALDKS